MSRRLFTTLLEQVEWGIDAEEIADFLWFAMQIGSDALAKKASTPIPEKRTQSNQQKRTSKAGGNQQSPPDSQRQESEFQLRANSTSSRRRARTQSIPEQGLPFQAPKAPALRQSLELGRALRPLMRKVPSRIEQVLDEEATAAQIAECRFYVPVLCPALERWLDLALVVEEWRSTVIWQETIAEFQKLLEHQGAFRDVRTWSLKTLDDGTQQLFPRQGGTTIGQKPRSPKELSESSGRRLILLISDCTSAAWQQSKIYDLLHLWAQDSPVAVIQLLPSRLWKRTALGYSFPVQLSAMTPGVPNTKFVEEGIPEWEALNPATFLKLPIVTLEPEPMLQWARVTAGVGNTQTAGFVIDSLLVKARSQESVSEAAPLLSARELVKRFRETASPLAQRLAGMMAAVPISLPVIHLIQETLLPESTQVHIAEVLMSGLVQRHAPDGSGMSYESAQYEFLDDDELVDGVNGLQAETIRNLLIDGVRVPETDAVLEAVSQYVARKAGLSIRTFTALLVASSAQEAAKQSTILPFARIAKQVLRRMGGEYAALVEQIEQQPILVEALQVSEQFPPLQTFEFDVAEIAFEELPAPRLALEPFAFEMATIAITPGQTAFATSDLLSLFQAIDQAVYAQTGKPLGDVERGIFTGSWNGMSYSAMAADLGCSRSHISSKAADFWRSLSQVTGKQVTKTTLRQVVTEWATDGILGAVVISRTVGEGQQFVEDLGNSVLLEMVQIPGGSFLMGSPEDELEREKYESPQHTVTIAPFFLGKYPITQAQWRAVAALPQVNRELDADPSEFKGDNRPVENVSWLDAVEFCDRLSQHTGRPYRLPSEAEWEYACRAGTTTPFHFGETITPELANYYWSEAYGNIKVTKEKDFRGTTPVGQFGIANAFGLYDMHGNVWEWCQDHWHDNYEGAPSDGSAWINPEASEDAPRLLRGGSWVSIPRYCRSALRFLNYADFRGNYFGFRVSCSA